MIRRGHLFFSVIIILIGIFYFTNFSAKADQQNTKLLISEIQIGGASVYDEFIELYNPGSTTIDFTGWKLKKKSSSGSQEYDFFSEAKTHLSVPPHRHILIAPNGFSSTTADINYTTSSISIATNNTILLYNSSAELIDKVGMGSAQDFESSSTPNPPNGQSIERNPGGENGNTQDTDNNFNDFIISFIPNPENLSSPARPPIQIPTNTSPTAIIHSSSTGYIDEEMKFDASSSTDDENDNLNYYWDFGDSSTSAEIIAQHIFPEAKEYLITLTVTDIEDASSTATSSITILPTETPPPTPSSTSSTASALHDIVINEFVSGPTSSSPEWIEFYNNTSSTIDLNGWYVNEGSGKTTTLATTTTPLEPNDFFVIYSIEGNLNNTGDLIILKDALNNIIDQISYGIWDDGNTSDNAPAVDDNNATARNIDGLSTSNDKADFSITITPTAGLPNTITPKPSSSGGGSYTAPKQETLKTDATTTPTTTPTTTIKYSDKIIINEILPRPSIDETNNEFIELKNISTSSVDLAGWILGDNSTNKYNLPLNNPASTTIASSSLLVIKRAQSKIALNNSGVEAVKLYSPDEKLVDLVEYKGPVEKNYSYSRNEKGLFSWTSVPTPGTENIFSSSTSEGDTPDDSSQDITSPTALTKKTTTKTTTVKVTKVTAPAQRIDLENISSLALDSKVITQGIISVEPGILGTQIFYLSGSGIQIYCNKKDFPTLKVGDTIEVNGVLSEASGERRIKITGQSDIKIISQGQTPEIHQISTSEVSEEMVGSLAKIKGEVLEVKGSYIYLDDGSEEAKIYLKASTGITVKDLNIKPGDNIEVTGIVSNASGGYRLLPRYITDIMKIGEVKGDFATSTSAENTKSQAWKYFSAIIVFLILIITWLVWKFNQKK